MAPAQKPKQEKYRQENHKQENHKQEKAYKLLAIQQGLSFKEAKRYCDRGMVYIGNTKLKIARSLLPIQTKFRLLNDVKTTLIYEDSDLIVLNKPPFLSAHECLKPYPNGTLLHRLDKPTSGLLLLGKNEPFRQKVIEEFRQQRVYKAYEAIVFGIVNSEERIDAPLLSQRKNNRVTTKVSAQGKSAITHIKPLEVVGKKSKLEVVIETGRTHQIRVHLAHIGYPIVGDELYAPPSKAKRLLLHAKVIKLLDYTFTQPAGEDFVI